MQNPPRHVVLIHRLFGAPSSRITAIEIGLQSSQLILLHENLLIQLLHATRQRNHLLLQLFFFVFGLQSCGACFLQLPL
jgi:hypothetical protein